MSEYLHKQHNVSVLLYHIVCACKYRRLVISDKVDTILKDTCLEISKRYEIIFLEIGVEKEHVHFLIQSVPSYSPTKIVRTMKSITAREVFKKVPEARKQLWGGEFWGKGYFISTVGRHGDEGTIAQYVKNQCKSKEYKTLHRNQMQLNLF